MAMRKSRGRPAHEDLLTPAEWRVAEGIRHGMTNRVVAQRLGISIDGVKFHVANILQKLDFSGRQELRRWDGVRRGSALEPGRNRMMANAGLGSIGQIARSVKDIDAACAFYGETLGLPHLYTYGTLAFFDCGGVRLFLSQGDGGVAESILYFRVGDIHAAQRDLEAKGVAFTHAPHMIHRHQDGTEEWMAFFEDNEGRPLALMCQVAPPG
jgi:DNA-binding CsgD family transcriptional regulator/catechol 2,3-dioxygenase-like lactoylglutathione lyase family enzyme